MPDFAAINGNDSAQFNELQRNASTALSDQKKRPVDRRGVPLPIRKSGYDALDKNSFLKLLVTQLAKQDPTNPMNDREFISQMAQFSSLEQMNNVANSMNKLRASQANQLIGKMINGKDFVTEKPVQGIATKATYDRNGEVFLSVNGRMIKLDDVTEVTEVTPIAPPQPVGNVSRETLTSGNAPLDSALKQRPEDGSRGAVARETAPAANVRSLSAVEAPAPKVNPAQATQAYEANQKAVNVSRETPDNAKINKEIPKGE
ncbi:MAG TPA: flagellar hook capping FlgD N-terminal domain-containing protein [Turneriella sp.]|nr:flagellar hook capping FlgD N-terminal domain-containing protein [Turneriella sp.]